MSFNFAEIIHKLGFAALELCFQFVRHCAGRCGEFKRGIGALEINASHTAGLIQLFNLEGESLQICMSRGGAFGAYVSVIIQKLLNRAVRHYFAYGRASAVNKLQPISQFYKIDRRHTQLIKAHAALRNGAYNFTDYFDYWVV